MWRTQGRKWWWKKWVNGVEKCVDIARWFLGSSVSLTPTIQILWLSVLAFPFLYFWQGTSAVLKYFFWLILLSLGESNSIIQLHPIIQPQKPLCIFFTILKKINTPVKMHTLYFPNQNISGVTLPIITHTAHYLAITHTCCCLAFSSFYQNVHGGLSSVPCMFIPFWSLSLRISLWFIHFPQKHFFLFCQGSSQKINKGD